MEFYLQFNASRRTYFVVFDIGLDGTLKYGATIKKHPGPITRINISTEEKHLNTAYERFERFPVETSIKLPETVRTRGELKNFLVTKKFKKMILGKFAKFGVRSRNGNMSLKTNEYNFTLCQLKKQKNRALCNYYNTINRHNKLHENDNFNTRGFDDGITPDWEKCDTFQSLVEADGRIFHFSYKRDAQTGKMKYGACVFNPKTQEDWDNYDEDAHYDTSQTRMERFPVYAHFDNEHTHNTRLQASGEIQFTSPKSAIKMRKMVAKYGVRNRGNNKRFLGTHKANRILRSITKKTNRKIGTLLRDVKQWNTRRQSSTC